MAIERQLLIGGDNVPAAGARRTEDRDPYTGDVYATVAAAGPEDARRAVDAAAAALPAWAQMAPSERRKLLLRAAELLSSRASEAADLMTAETGAIRPWALFNVELAAEMLREAAAWVTHPVGEVLPTSTPAALSLSLRQPAGVVAAFAPWNAPIILGIRSVASPLATGNTVVMKPSEHAPLAAGLFLADVLHEAGFPPGVCNVVTTAPEDAPAVAEALIADPRVRRVSFTGSTRVGRAIGELAARHLTPAVLELGGKNALIILADADLDYATDAVAFGAYMNSGQICMSADRVLVHRAVADELASRLAEKAAKLPGGDPRDPGTLIGPLITKEAARRVASLVDEATAEGAKLCAGGGEPDGALYPASVLSGVTPRMRIETEEIFGPVCTMQAVEDLDEAVQLANATPYGLSAGVITEDVRRGLEVASRLRTGIVHVNDQPVDDEPQAPFGGIGDSGYGRFGGRSGVEAFTELRWVTVQQGHRRFPF
ncbi:MAG TPA: aldehyde dehydrogenase family protein [Acidimicrobiales bacterium]|nr:aldehyde dehydrogenase family protein [Acidimicrobiales bacterium]